MKLLLILFFVVSVLSVFFLMDLFTVGHEDFDPFAMLLNAKLFNDRLILFLLLCPLMMFTFIVVNYFIGRKGN